MGKLTEHCIREAHCTAVKVGEQMLFTFDDILKLVVDQSKAISEMAAK